MTATIAVLGDSAISKVNQLHTSKSRYLILTMMGDFLLDLELYLSLRLVGYSDLLTSPELNLFWVFHLE